MTEYNQENLTYYAEFEIYVDLDFMGEFQEIIEQKD